jgi:uncharacterized protein YndB with AHSA1/START domain
LHLTATRSRVWRALSNAEEFGGWFGVDFKGKSFVAGKPVQGQITYPGYEHLVMEVSIERVLPERLLSWRWHPAAHCSPWWNPAWTRFRRAAGRRYFV